MFHPSPLPSPQPPPPSLPPTPSPPSLLPFCVCVYVSERDSLSSGLLSLVYQSTFFKARTGYEYRVLSFRRRVRAFEGCRGTPGRVLGYDNMLICSSSPCALHRFISYLTPHLTSTHLPPTASPSLYVLMYTGTYVHTDTGTHTLPATAVQSLIKIKPTPG